MIIFAYCEPEFGQAPQKNWSWGASFCTSFSHKSDSKGWNRTNLTSWCEPPLSNYCLSSSMETGHSLLICPSSSTNQNCAHLKSGYFYLSDEVFRQKSRANIKPSSECSRSFFWPPQTRSTECINWLPPSAPCSWDVTFWMATTCVISRIESKHIQHHPTFVFSKNLAVKLIFQKKSEEIVQDVWQNQTSQPLKFPRLTGYIFCSFRLYHGPSPSPENGASASWC